MGMPVTVYIVDGSSTQRDIDAVFNYFTYIDEKFSTYKDTSEITNINKGLLSPEEWSMDMKTVFDLSKKTKEETFGYFDILNNHQHYDPSGLVKGWAIRNAANLLRNAGFKNFYIEAGGDIQVEGNSDKGSAWKVGIKNPFKVSEIIKVIYLKKNEGIATSGSYERGDHIYNPKNNKQRLVDIVSLTVIGRDVYEADRFATAAFAMQKEGIQFIETMSGLEGYTIDSKGTATMTSGFKEYTRPIA